MSDQRTEQSEATEQDAPAVDIDDAADWAGEEDILTEDGPQAEASADREHDDADDADDAARG